jgi:hypothetical protein
MVYSTKLTQHGRTQKTAKQGYRSFAQVII